VNNPPPHLPCLKSKYKAVSIIQITGEETNLKSLADSIRASVLRHYDKLQAGSDRVMLDEYNVRQMLRNCNVRVSLPNRILEGVATQVDIEGRLNIKTSDGTTHKIRSEDVLLIEIP